MDLSGAAPIIRTSGDIAYTRSIEEEQVSIGYWSKRHLDAKSSDLGYAKGLLLSMIES
jgi:hypothetical protein